MEHTAIYFETYLNYLSCFIEPPQIPDELESCYFETDDWEAYRSIVPTKQHKVGNHLIALSLKHQL